MILHDWQRGKIPFFVPPPKEEEDQVEAKDAAETIDDDKASAARKEIDNLILSQKIDEVLVQKDLFTEQELADSAALKSQIEE